jgi:DNA topoisomerase-6 subunit B
MAKAASKITASSTAEYFSKNLQQVGFSSQVKAVLTTLKEAVDNALDACEEHDILPEIEIWVEKLGTGSLKGSDKVRVKVSDNGPGIDPDDVPKVFGEYLASSKFGRGRCSRGQQGIGISAATTWAQLTNAIGARVITKTAGMRKAVSCLVEVDIKNNRGVLKDRETLDWDRPHGTSVEFIIDGRIQLNGEAGLLNYLGGTTLVNPHLTLHHNLPAGSEKELERTSVPRVSDEIPHIPEATEPHPHTMKLGEFIAHSHIFGKVKVGAWLKKGFSRVHEGTIKELIQAGVKKAVFEKSVDALSDIEFKELFTTIQNIQLMAPSTKSVLSIGEEALSKSIGRLGAVDFFSVVTRKPTICDFKPVEVEVAIARLEEKGMEHDSPVSVLRFANRVPLQFDKAACAIVQAIQTVNWRAYGLGQPKDALPTGPYIIAVSVVSPFIKFKNASKETVDASDELVEEIRRALIQAGQRLSKHIRREDKASELEEKIRHIEQFGPILVDGLARITKASDVRKKRAEEGLLKLLGREAKDAEVALKDAEQILSQHKAKSEVVDAIEISEEREEVQAELTVKAAKGKKKPVAKKTSAKKPKIITKGARA